MAITRLDKYLADAGIGTRSQVKQYIRKGAVTVNGTPVTTPELKVNSSDDIITCQGQTILRADYVYYLLNKPAGCVSATEDNLHPTVLQLIHDTSHKDLFPVGRLDIDTEGLLLITNDGVLAHQLLSPKKHVDKVYFVETDNPIPVEAGLQFQHGIDIGDAQPTRPAELELLTETTAHLTIHEGRFHQVKRMFHAVGCEVTYLKRVQMGSLSLDEALAPGEYRALQESELISLKEL